MLRIARVLIEHPVHSLDTPFDYLINDDLDVKKGVRVEVSFNNQNIIGYVLDIYTLNMTMDEYIIENGFELKSIDKVIDLPKRRGRVKSIVALPSFIMVLIYCVLST